jgi:hypothetical protein
VRHGLNELGTSEVDSPFKMKRQAQQKEMSGNSHSSCTEYQVLLLLITLVISTELSEYTLSKTDAQNHNKV